MRVALAILLLSGVAAFLISIRGAGVDEWLSGVLDSNSDSGSPERGRREGVRAAERDLARGTPCIRRPLDTFDNLGPDGVGIDRDTGLPLDNTVLMCGTGVDFVAYKAEIKAYNQRILAAYEKGDLKGLTLGHKIRTKSATQALFAASRPQRLAKDGDRASVSEGKFVLTYHHEVFEDGSDYEHATLTGPEGEPRPLRLFYPAPFKERPGTLWTTSAPGPFDLLVVDDETTAILRDADGFAWVIDLPRGIVVQVLSTNS